MIEADKTKVILASGSPRRRELLKMLFDNFEIWVSDCEEIVTSWIPEEVTKELSRQKAESVAMTIMPGDGSLKQAVVIGADTVVSVDGKILGKPRNRQEAYEMISGLSGKSHAVSTGVTLIYVNEQGYLKKINSFAETTIVHVAVLSEKEIEVYVDTDEPYDKAGGYGIQGLFGKHVTGIEGDYNNVVGLPVHRLYEEWKQFQKE